MVVHFQRSCFFSCTLKGIQSTCALKHLYEVIIFHNESQDTYICSYTINVTPNVTLKLQDQDHHLLHGIINISCILTSFAVIDLEG